MLSIPISIYPKKKRKEKFLYLDKKITPMNLVNPEYQSAASQFYFIFLTFICT